MSASPCSAMRSLSRCGGRARCLRARRRRAAALVCAPAAPRALRRAAPQRLLDLLDRRSVSPAHAGTAFLSFVNPSCSERRAASTEQPIAAAISRCGRSRRSAARPPSAGARAAPPPPATARPRAPAAAPARSAPRPRARPARRGAAAGARARGARRAPCAGRSSAPTRAGSIARAGAGRRAARR